MMDNTLHIVPYTKEHGQFILSCQMNHKVLEADSKYIKVMGDAQNLEQDNLSFTAIANNRPVVSAGMKKVWGKVAEGWVIGTDEMWKYPIGIAKIIKRDFAKIAKEQGIERIQTAVRKDFKTGIRFVEWLGLEREGLMKKWGFDGSDQYLYARIF